MLHSGTFSNNCWSASDRSLRAGSELLGCTRSRYLLCPFLCISLMSRPTSTAMRDCCSWQNCWLFVFYSGGFREHQLIASPPEGILAKKQTLTSNYSFSLLRSYKDGITGYNSCLSKDLLWDTSSRMYSGYHLKYRPCCFDPQEGRNCHWKLILL